MTKVMTPPKALTYLLGMLVASCAAFELTPEEKAERERAKSVMVSQTGPSLAELPQYRELGPVKCEERITSYSDADEECRDELKLQTSRLGGDLVVIEVRDRARCPNNAQEQCVTLKGRAYKTKAKASK